MVTTSRQLSLSLLLALGLAACGGGGGTVTPPPADHLVTITAAEGSTQNRLACFKGTANPECDLRIYQVMVESYINGDDTINYNTGYGTSHHKGDLQGIINSLDYIKSTGVNAIWLTPVFESKSIGGQDSWTDRLDATGYFASDYFKVDPKFGTNAKFQELVDTAHAKGLYVFMDGVFGHYKSNLVASPTAKLPVNGLCVNSSGGTYTAGANTACADYSNAQTLAFFQEVVDYWITNYKIDGWRLDQGYQVPTDKWASLRQTALNSSAAVSYINSASATVHPLAYMVSEIWSGESTIASKAYGSNGSPALKSAFDFPSRYKVVQALATEESGYSNNIASNLTGSYGTYSAYPDHAMPNLMLTNHDLVRFGDLIQRAGLGNPSDASYWNRHKTAFAFMASHSGPITVYYGDEIGQEVANFSTKVDGSTCAAAGLCDDHVSRDSGKTTGLNTNQQNLKAYVASLMQLRVDNPALATGIRTHVYSDNYVYIDRKDTTTNHVLMVLNTNATTTTVVTLKATGIGASGNLTDLLSAATLSPSSGNFSITVAPLTARFFSF